MIPLSYILYTCTFQKIFISLSNLQIIPLDIWKNILETFKSIIVISVCVQSSIQTHNNHCLLFLSLFRSDTKPLLRTLLAFLSSLNITIIPPIQIKSQSLCRSPFLESYILPCMTFLLSLQTCHERISSNSSSSISRGYSFPKLWNVILF